MNILLIGFTFRVLQVQEQANELPYPTGNAYMPMPQPNIVPGACPSQPQA